jgi:hypothetical protein
MVVQAAVVHIKEQRRAMEIHHLRLHLKETTEEPEAVVHQDLAVLAVVGLAQLVVMELLPMVVLAALELQAQFLELL